MMSAISSLSSLEASIGSLLDVDSFHYRKRLNFRGPRYFRRPAHENTDIIFVGP
jgi:hypothetical protein